MCYKSLALSNVLILAFTVHIQYTTCHAQHSDSPGRPWYTVGSFSHTQPGRLEPAQSSLARGVSHQGTSQR